jgi:hypothetical protein
VHIFVTDETKCSFQKAKKGWQKKLSISSICDFAGSSGLKRCRMKLQDGLTTILQAKIDCTLSIVHRQADESGHPRVFRSASQRQNPRVLLDFSSADEAFTQHYQTLTDMHRDIQLAGSCWQSRGWLHVSCGSGINRQRP